VAPVELEGVSGGAILDTELMDVLNLAGTQLLNNIATLDEFPTLKPGTNIVSWTGNVTRLTITPRWRNI
jgi:phage-related protein